MLRSITWDFHVDDSQGNHKYDIILGREIFSGLQIYPCFFNNNIRINGGKLKVCMVQMKDMTDINFKVSSACPNEKKYWKKELRESGHVMDTTRRI